ncbi:hypothetical protein K1719_000449 [Acacia pycnantha]|nr:hypothetical protein K1719_000449 [Acacia pycnantha]
MCHPAISLITCNNDHGRRDVLQPPPRPVAAAPGERTGSVKKYCICSPTHHPGSFRCRQHRADYAWRGKSGQLSSSPSLASFDHHSTITTNNTTISPKGDN